MKCRPLNKINTIVLQQKYCKLIEMTFNESITDRNVPIEQQWQDDGFWWYAFYRRMISTAIQTKNTIVYAHTLQTEGLNIQNLHQSFFLK